MKLLLIIIINISFLFANIEEEIIAIYKKEYPNIEISSISFSPNLPEHYKNIDFHLINTKRNYFTLKIDNKYYFGKLNAFIKVYIANSTIYKNEEIENKVLLEKIKFKFFYSKPIIDIKNKIATHIISRNNIITENNTKIKPLIIKNSIIPVIFKNSNIEIYTKGIALNDANENETIKIKIKSNIYKGIIKNGIAIIK